MRIYSGGPLQVPETSLGKVFFDRVKTGGDRVAFKARHKAGEAYYDLTWTQAGEAVREVANGLLSAGAQKGDRVAIVSDTRWEWSLADYAILAAGGVTVTVYPTLTPDQIAYLLNDSQTKLVFCSDKVQFEKVAQVHGQLKTVEKIITFEDVQPPNGLAKNTLTLNTLREDGRTYAIANPAALELRTNAVKSDDYATIVYTSGTTGVPKGAVLTHKNFISAYLSASQTLELDPGKHWTTLLFLPLAHCYGRLVCFMLVHLQGMVAFSTPASLGDDLRATRPSVVASVPRLYERMYDQVMSAIAKESPGKQKLVGNAFQVAREMGRARANAGSPGLGLQLKHMFFDKLVFSKLRDKMGLTNLEIGFTGAAAIRPDLLYFFQGIGVNILEGYGLTETSAPSNVNKPRKYKPGTVGPPFPGMEMILDAEGIDQVAGGRERGEILMRGPNVFMGYYNLQSETDACFGVIDGKRWFRTGDIGEFDEDGYLKIVDRKKELEVLNTGKKIAPVTVEEKLKVSPYIAEAMLVATDRKFAGCLIQPNYDRLVEWARGQGIQFDASKVVIKPDPTGQPMTYAVGDDLLNNAKVQEMYKGEIAKTNQQCADFEQIRVFRLIPHAVTMDRDELTPTLKKKRRVIAKNYADLIEDMFSGNSR